MQFVREPRALILERDKHHPNNQTIHSISWDPEAKNSIKLQERKKQQNNALSHSLMETDKKPDCSEGLILKILHVTEEGK